MHVNKSMSLQGARRANGSVAFTNAARSVLLFNKHPDDPALIVVEQVKQNLSADVRTFGYKFHPREWIDPANPDGPPITAAQIGCISLSDEQFEAYHTAKTSRGSWKSQEGVFGRPPKALALQRHVFCQIATLLLQRGFRPDDKSSGGCSAKQAS